MIATDTMDPNNNFKSESNWLYFEILCEEPPDEKNPETKIPTVFTPNGDGSNEVFTITTGYDFAEVSIYNRWGKPVFTYSGEAQQVAWNGADQNSGQLVSDGVYYYIIKLDGEFADGQGGVKNLSEEKTGAITIFTNGTK